jgi:uncharacterized small protein (DUF1192 family)
MTKKIKDTKGLVKTLTTKAKKKGKPTPGPWAVHENPHGYEIRASDTYYRVSIAFLGAASAFTGEGFYTIDDAEDQANAKLIARAPGMLEEIKELEDIIAELKAEIDRLNYQCELKLMNSCKECDY